MFRLPLLIASIALLSACVTQQKEVNLGNGVRGFRITCSGLPISGDGDCDSRASSLCSDGYTVLKQEDPPSAHMERWWRESTHDILVSCNTPQSQQSPVFQ